jgi:hypothetical protein
MRDSSSSSCATSRVVIGNSCKNGSGMEVVVAVVLIVIVPVILVIVVPIVLVVMVLVKIFIIMVMEW